MGPLFIEGPRFCLTSLQSPVNLSHVQTLVILKSLHNKFSDLSHAYLLYIDKIVSNKKHVRKNSHCLSGERLFLLDCPNLLKKRRFL